MNDNSIFKSKQTGKLSTCNRNIPGILNVTLLHVRKINLLTEGENVVCNVLCNVTQCQTCDQVVSCLTLRNVASRSTREPLSPSSQSMVILWFSTTGILGRTSTQADISTSMASSTFTFLLYVLSALCCKADFSTGRLGNCPEWQNFGAGKFRECTFIC